MNSVPFRFWCIMSDLNKKKEEKKDVLTKAKEDSVVNIGQDAVSGATSSKNQEQPMQIDSDPTLSDDFKNSTVGDCIVM